MSIIAKLFGKREKSASVARDRLQIIIAQERVKSQAPDYLPTLQRELLEVLSKYVTVSPEDIRIAHEKQDGMDVLELNITLPEDNTSTATEAAKA
ncbi:cell division topological specificity factor MinE [Neisseriaceae bacterium CLB008]